MLVLSIPVLWTQLELNGKINKEESKVAVNPRSIVLLLAKDGEGYWPRLLRAPGKMPGNIKVDWNKVGIVASLHLPLAK